MTGASLLAHIGSYSVSSVLSRDAKSFGKQFLFDGSRGTCWNSEQGSPQHVLVEFARAVRIESVRIQFQGGFAGRDTRLIDLDRKQVVALLHPADTNKLQSFPLPAAEQAVPRRRIKLQFLSSTDFYGRIVVYSLDFCGRPADDSGGSAGVPRADGTRNNNGGSNGGCPGGTVITIL
ncbi:Nuclear receptor 2C2-associated protein [Coemansia javaensis]|uniref:Nuclear receptor 2C2-associated protein n=1 Tax=Coemansia javaensis TaxID=2761396 RepID=A0A9W8HAH7_9FUNG|nr:Nuclear receptor 2C2-associated protein [Coemansia javaensis]